MTHVLIAGSGLAGSALAIQLGRLGFSVELFERARFLGQNPAAKVSCPQALQQ